MNYKQHKGNLRGQIKSQVERKLYNKRIRAEVIPDESILIPIKCYTCNCTIGIKGRDNYCNMCGHYF